MMKRLRPQLPSPAMVVAILALVVALSGSAIAAVIVSSPSQLGKNVVTGKKIKKNAVTSKKVKDHSLLGKDFKSGQLPAGAKGDKGDKGDPGTSVFASSLPSGQTMKGVWGGRFPTPTANTYQDSPRIGFPVPAPAGLTDAQVSFPAGTANAAPGDLDPTCTGTAEAPTAPAGKVCVYVDSQSASVTSPRRTTVGWREQRTVQARLRGRGHGHRRREREHGSPRDLGVHGSVSDTFRPRCRCISAGSGRGRHGAGALVLSSSCSSSWAASSMSLWCHSAAR